MIDLNGHTESTSLPIEHDCKYYNEGLFNQEMFKVSSNSISYLALDLRSMVNKLDKLETFLAIPYTGSLMS